MRHPWLIYMSAQLKISDIFYVVHNTQLLYMYMDLKLQRPCAYLCAEARVYAYG